MALRSIGQSAGAAETLAALGERLDRLEEAGVEVAELMPDRYWVLTGGNVNARRLEFLQRTLVDRPLRYTIHAPFALNLFDRRHLGLQERLFAACIEVAAAVGAEVIVYHSGRREPGGADGLDLDGLLALEQAGLRAAGDLAAAHGILIAVENMTPTSERKAGMPPACVPYGADLRSLAEQIATVNHTQVGICLDFGHAWLFEQSTGGDLIEAAATAAPLVVHTHIHDNFGRPDMHPHYPAHPDLRAIGESDLHMPVGWGTIPFRELLERVAFPRDPIALSEVGWIDDGVLAATVAALGEMVEVNSRAGNVAVPSR